MADRLCPRQIEFVIKVFSGIVPVQVLHFFQEDGLFIGNVERNSVHGNTGDWQEKASPGFFLQLRFQEHVVAGGGIVTGDDAPESNGGLENMAAVAGDEVKVHMVFHRLAFIRNGRNCFRLDSRHCLHFLFRRNEYVVPDSRHENGILEKWTTCSGSPQEDA